MSLPADVEHWLLANHQKKVYVLRESQDMKKFLPTYLKPEYDTDSLMLPLNASRMIKDHGEINLVCEAIKASALADRTVMHHITSMKPKAEVLCSFYVRIHGAKWQAYPSIVASGANYAILHYTENNMLLHGRSLLGLDARCEWGCHSSDVTYVSSVTGLLPCKTDLELPNACEAWLCPSNMQC